MLNFLKQKIAERERQLQNTIQEQVDNSDSEMDEAILECAHLFQEMEDLSITGTNVLRERPVIDIPIEDDVELTTVEYDYMTDRIIDAPMDVQASEAYSKEKHIEDFVEVAYKTVGRLAREKDQQYEARVMEYATAEYNKYHEWIIQEGLFGNDLLDVSDERIPTTKLVDLGPYEYDDPKSKHYVTKLPVYFEITPDHKININQIYALNVIENLGCFERFGKALRRALITDHGLGKELYDSSVWEIATPLRILVPQVKQYYTVNIVFEIEGMKRPYIFGVDVPTSSVRTTKNGKIENLAEAKKKFDEADEGDKKNKYFSVKNIDNEANYASKKDYKKPKAEKVQESVTPLSRWSYGRSNIFQEAIDFGGDAQVAPTAGAPDPNAVQDPNAAPNPAPAADPATTAPAIDAAAAPDAGAPAVDGMGIDNSADPAAVGDTNDQAPAATVTTNDVSEQIANNVANITAANASADADLMSSTPTFDANVDDTFNNLDSAVSGTDNLDVPASDTTDTNMDTSADATNDTTDNVPEVGSDPLADLGADATDSIGDTSLDNDTTDTDLDTDTSGGIGDVDIDNMSMDDMVTQAVEKIKTMPMNKLRDFLTDGVTESAVYVDNLELNDTIMESVTDPIDQVKLTVRKVLGDLNDRVGSITDIFKNVKRDHKYANRAITNALKSENVDKHAKIELEKLNHSMNEMVLKLDNPSRDNVESIKNSIRNFTNATAKTSKFIDFNKGIVTESFTIFMNEDDAGYVMESAHGKVVKNTLWGWFIGHFGVRANNATKKGGKNRYHLHAPTFILFLFGFPFTASIWNAIHANRLSKDEIDDIAVKTVIKDMSKISNTLFESSDGSVEILKMRKFRHAVDDLSDDLKYIIKKLDPKATKLRENLTKLKGSADACLDHVYNGSGDAGKYLQELLDNMDATAKILCDVDKVIESHKDDPMFKEILEIQKLTADDFPEDDTDDNTNDKDGE